MKKILAILLALCLMLATFSGCSGGSGGSSSDDGAKAEEGNSEAQKTDFENLTIEETVIYEGNDIKLVAKRLFVSVDGELVVSMFEENPKGKQVSFNEKNCLINGFYSYSKSATGKYENGQRFVGIYITEDILEYGGKKYWGTDQILTIACPMATLTIDGEDIRVPFTLTTNVAADNEVNVDRSGEKLYEKDGITIIYKGTEPDTLGEHVTMLIINETDTNLIVETNKGSINGVDDSLSSMFDLVYPNSITLARLLIKPSDLENNGIDKAEHLRFAFSFTNADNYKFLYKSEEVEIDLTK